MKAIVRHKYGSPDVLKLEELPKPTARDDRLLVKVEAVSLNAADWEILRADPLYVRFVGFGLRNPKIKVLGSDIAGRVEAVGKNVKEFQPGDEVFADIFGEGMGGLAEYVCVPESAPVARKPAAMTFEEAATIPQAGFIALQGLRDKAQVQPGQKVLIIGAGGGAGTFAIQIAKSFGAEVTGVDSTAKLEMMRSIGADRVIDYTQDDFAQSGERYDLILDVVGHRSLFDFKRVLSPKGTYVIAGGTTARIFKAVIVGRLLSMIGSQSMGLLATRPNKRDLAVMIELIEAGKVAPVIDRRYTLSEVADALRYLGEGHAKGKVVVTV